MHWNRRELIRTSSLLLPAILLCGPALAEEERAVEERAEARRAIGKVDALEGAVFRQLGGSLAPLHRGDSIYGDDALVTGEAAKLQVRLSDGSILLLGAGTTAELKNLVLPTGETAGQGLIMMGGGILRVILQGGGWQSLSVESTTAIASVRGTDFLVESGAKESAVFVVNGLVQVSGKAGGAVRLAAGFGTDVVFGQVPARAKRWDSARAAAALARVTVWP